jgi:hypothetical protein
MVGHRRLAPPGDVGMARAVGGVAGVDEASPGRGALLGLAHQHQPEPSGGQGGVLVGTGGVFFGLAGLKAQHRDRRGANERVEITQQPLVVAVQRGGRGNGVARSTKNFTSPPSYCKPGI